MLVSWDGWNGGGVFVCGIGLELVSVCLGFGGCQKGLQGLHPRGGETARGGKVQLRWQLLGIPPKDLECIGIPHEPRVAAHFADRAEDGDGPELFEEVSISQQRPLERGRFARGKVCSNSLNGGRDLACGKPELFQDWGHLADGIGHVVPCSERRWGFRTVADEDPQIMHPCRGIEDIVIVRPAFRQACGELIKPGLVTELVRRLRLGANVVHNGFSVSGLMHGVRIAAPLMNSNPSVWSKVPLALPQKTLCGAGAGIMTGNRLKPLRGACLKFRQKKACYSAEKGQCSPVC